MAWVEGRYFYCLLLQFLRNEVAPSYDAHSSCHGTETNLLVWVKLFLVQWRIPILACCIHPLILLHFSSSILHDREYVPCLILFFFPSPPAGRKCLYYRLWFTHPVVSNTDPAPRALSPGTQAVPCMILSSEHISEVSLSEGAWKERVVGFWRLLLWCAHVFGLFGSAPVSFLFDSSFFLKGWAPACSPPYLLAIPSLCPSILWLILH